MWGGGNGGDVALLLGLGVGPGRSSSALSTVWGVFPSRLWWERLESVLTGPGVQPTLMHGGLIDTVAFRLICGSVLQPAAKVLPRH